MNEKSVVGWALPTKAEKCVSSSKESVSLVPLPMMSYQIRLDNPLFKRAIAHNTFACIEMHPYLSRVYLGVLLDV